MFYPNSSVSKRRACLAESANWLRRRASLARLVKTLAKRAELHSTSLAKEGGDIPSIPLRVNFDIPNFVALRRPEYQIRLLPAEGRLLE